MFRFSPQVRVPESAAQGLTVLAKQWDEEDELVRNRANAWWNEKLIWPPMSAATPAALDRFSLESGTYRPNPRTVEFHNRWSLSAKVTYSAPSVAS
ncbi:MAG TPA: hypothetical protein EYG57_17015 [Planctomycetes bacterium]|nr:hypothetical protein [Planctomycetaceae bacterium]HIM31234.1 hypothetical protein [Planctomycetota bacterium]